MLLIVRESIKFMGFKFDSFFFTFISRNSTKVLGFCANFAVKCENCTHFNHLRLSIVRYYGNIVAFTDNRWETPLIFFFFFTCHTHSNFSFEYMYLFHLFFHFSMKNIHILFSKQNKLINLNKISKKLVDRLLILLLIRMPCANFGCGDYELLRI